MRNLLTLLVISCSLSCNAGVEVLPISRHQQFLTYGLFTEEQLIFAYEDAGRAWVGIGSGIAVLEAKDMLFTPQLIVFANVTAGMRQDLSFIDFNTETVDTRFGLSMENRVTDAFRFAITYTHSSGHTCDGVKDLDLVAPNSGDDILGVRAIYDYEDLFRIGVTLKPYFNSDPIMNFFAADQFIEWFPFHTAASATHPTPYLSFGIEEYGRHRIEPTLHLQLGAYLGNHMKPEHHPAMRFMVGAYSGWDPRLKYAQLKEAKINQFYFGFGFNF